MIAETRAPSKPSKPSLVSTGIWFCVPHRAVGHEMLDWSPCRFKQLFYLDPEPADPWAALGLRDDPEGEPAGGQTPTGPLGSDGSEG